MIALSNIISAVKLTAFTSLMCVVVSSATAAPVSDTIQIYKNSLSKTYRISLYPDANQQVVFFSVRGDNGKAYQLYVFDIDGNMIKQAETRNKQTTVIKDIQKGVYLFEVFSDDTRIGNGRIAVK